MSISDIKPISKSSKDIKDKSYFSFFDEGLELNHKTAAQSVSKAWRLIRKKPSLIFFKALADIADQMATLAVITIVMTVIFMRLFDISDPALWSGVLKELAFTPSFSLGLAGVLATTACMLFLFRALIDAGIWGAFRRTLIHDQKTLSEIYITFTEGAMPYLGRAIMWHAFRKIIYISAALLGGMVYISLIKAASISESAVLMPSFLLAFFYPALLIYMILVEVTLEVMPAILTLHTRKPFGESILDAASLALGHWLSIYRIFVLSVGITIIPLLLFMGSIGLEQLVSENAVLVSATVIIRFGIQFLLFISIITAGIVFRGSTIIYLAEGAGLGHAESLFAGHEDDNENPAFSDKLNFYNILGIKPLVKDKNTSIEDYLPQETPNIFSMEDLQLTTRLNASQNHLNNEEE